MVISMLPRPNSASDPSIKNPAQYFQDVGNLHDAEVSEFRWSPVKHEIVVMVDDLYANFAGLPEYEGLQPVQLIFSAVLRIQLDVTPDKFPLRIMDFEVEESTTSPCLAVTIQFYPSGTARLDCDTIGCQPR
jgi:hypothetical protein